MIKTVKVPTLPNNQLKTIGWDWLIGEDTQPYVTDQLVEVTETEAEKYYEAANQLYDMYVEAAQYAIDNNLLGEMGIPENLHEIIKYTWNDHEHQWHLYGRFDLAGGLDGKPIKLIEFNANTATCIPETAIVQAAQLMANGYDDTRQFNLLYDALVENFHRVKDRNAHLDASILLTTFEGYPEDDANLAVLAEAAKDAGFFAKTEYIENVEFSVEEGIFKYDPIENQYEQFNFMFTLVPWEFIGWDEPELAQTLTQLVVNNKILVLNPAYTLVFQSKYILKLLWDLFPNHPLLLETSTEPLQGKKQVEKVFFGREGANVSVIDQQNRLESQGDYAGQPVVYQAYEEFMKDNHQNHYQAGVFYAFEACGLGFRRGGEILDNQAQFCGHLIV